SYNADDLTELTGAAATIRTETDEVLKSSNDPQEDLSSGENRLNQLVLEAKARAFENAHADILDPTQAPTKDDLKQAIEDAALLSPEVVTILQGRTEDDGTTPAPVLTAIGERYKDMIQADIAEALAGEDNADIRRESIATLQAAVENLELTAGDTDLTDLKTLPGAADALLDKAQKIDRVLDHYRDQIDDSVKNDEMVAFCDTAAQNIISGTTTPDDAIITLNRMEAKAKILQSAEGATEIPGVQDVLDAVDTELAKRSDPNEIEAYQAHAIDQITACKTAKAQLDKLLDTVGALEHVTEAQKADWTAAAQEDYNEFLTAVTTAADATAIEAAEQDFSADLLAIAKDVAKEEIASATQKETDTIAGYTYSDEAQKQVYLDLITSEKQATLTAIDQSTTDTQDKVFEELTELLDKLSQIAAQADEEEREACVVSAEKELEQSYIPSDYSTERQNELLGIVHEYSKQLDEENAVAETEALLAEALTKIDAIPNLLEEAQAAAEARLRAAYEELMLREHCYSAENLAKLSDFYQRTLIELKQFTAVADTAAATALADERITLMRNIPLDRIYTPDGLLASQETVTVPDGYDPSANGYSGKIEATNGLSATATVTVTPADSTSVAEKIKEAAKDKRIFLSDGSRVSKDLLSLLKNCHVTSALRIELGGTPLAATEHYTVSILLPEGTDLSRIIGVVYLNEDGSAEYMEIASEATLIQFITTHFSDFYLVSENTVNLLPWIVLLCVIILCEALALVLLSLKKSKREKQATLNSLTILPAITALTIYRPAGGVWILSILIVIAVALAVWLTWLILSLRRKPQAETEPIAEETVDIPTEPEPEPEPIPEVEELTHPDPLSTVTAEEAEDLMSDIEAKEELAEETAGYEDPERYSGTKKAEINIDTISEHFESGDTVTLNSLKAKRLIPNSAGAVKILARGFLDKPLTIVAQDFSTAALKMILLTGGTPIVTHASPERGGKRKVTK
ncbi:MAG: uL15 family ribosomal protein, partial [Clostridia bacterium]|nr:uL15 family ribosomal protein [Clostridia bacterium]